ncbi:hypothetical protein BDV93DRAFT_490502 [Ceratobasidium sp. AG-I]|nr:hypothetical protein BDV93DRAFT_490502 [Ceratobasidium sp. AG-I]
MLLRNAHRPLVRPIPTFYASITVPSASSLDRPRLNHSTPRRPYKIEVGVSFAAKPPLEYKGRPKRRTVAFPADHPIAKWRDALLQWKPKRIITDSAGEDFFFVEQVTFASYVYQMRNKSGVSLGVSDGVGGWSDDGVDPSLFSQSLMHFASKHAATSWAGEPDYDPIEETAKLEKSDVTLSPVEIIARAYQNVLDEPAVQCGSSTACIVNIDAQSGRLSAANLGDSSFSILRSSSIFHEQKPQTHYFNCPRQLAKLLPTHKPHLRIRDRPEHAAVYSAQLRHGDLVILSTDGLGDNVHPGEIIGISSLVGRRAASQPDQNLAQNLADSLVEYAVACMHSYDKVSPFEIAAQEEGMEHPGGKVDDVTVVVAHVIENS